MPTPGLTRRWTETAPLTRRFPTLPSQRHPYNLRRRAHLPVSRPGHQRHQRRDQPRGKVVLSRCFPTMLPFRLRRSRRRRTVWPRPEHSLAPRLFTRSARPTVPHRRCPPSATIPCSATSKGDWFACHRTRAFVPLRPTLPAQTRACIEVKARVKLVS